MDIRKILKALGIIQEVSNKIRAKRLGRGFDTAHRLNPWNPLSYIFIIGGLAICIILFGVYGFAKEVEWRNPFKWD